MLRKARLSPLLWALAALVSFTAAYYAKGLMMDVESWLIGHAKFVTSTAPNYLAVGLLNVFSLLLTALFVPVLVGLLFRRLGPRPLIKDTFILTSLIISVLSFLSDLLAMGIIRANPVPSPGSPPILFLMDPVEALQSYFLTALPTGLTAGALILLGASLSRVRGPAGTTAAPTRGGITRPYLPWLVAGILSVLPVCAGAVVTVAFTTGINSYPAYWPLARSILTVSVVPISAVLGYLAQGTDFGFSFRRSFVLPTILALSLYTGFAGIGYGFDLFIPIVLSSPTVLFLVAAVSLPVALTVGAMTFAASRIAVLRAAGVRIEGALTAE
jgi:hypothetical protein